MEERLDLGRGELRERDAPEPRGQVPLDVHPVALEGRPGPENERGSGPRKDDWLFIVETIEFLPAKSTIVGSHPRRRCQPSSPNVGPARP